MKETQSYLALDFLRGLAALTVFLCHIRGASFVEFGALPAHQQTVAVAALFALTRVGHEAVMVFFVLSGFLVGGQIINRIRSDRFDLTAYAIDRATRIFVPLIPACLLTAGIARLAFGIPLNWTQIGTNTFGLNNITDSTLPQNAPLWSLAYEIWFYVFAGAVAYTLSARTLRLATLLAAICAVAIVSASNPFYLPFWCLGAAAIAFLQSQFKTRLAVIGIAVFAVGCISYELGARSRSFENLDLLPLSMSEACICLGIALTLPKLCTNKADNVFAQFTKPILALSRMSYSLYLVHYPLNCLLGLWMTKATALSLVSITMLSLRAGLVFAGAIVFYFCFEAHTDLVRRFFKRMGNTARFPRSSAVN